MIRRLQTKEELDRKKKRNNKILSLTMLSILLFSTIGYAFFINPDSSSSNNQNQGQNSDPAQSDKISFQYQGTQFVLISTLNQIKDVPIDITISPESYVNQPIYIDIKNEGVLRELVLNLGKISPTVQKACYGKCEENLPEKDCTSNLIVWNQSIDKRVYQKDKCIFIEVDITAADAFIYSLFNKPI